jgi:hypothetical protein
LRKNIKVIPEPYEVPDSEAIALAVWIQAKRLGRERREHAARERAKRQERENGE